MSTKRPTPETDAAWASWPYAGPGVHANFARKLERERDEALERADSKHGCWMFELKRATELEKQLEATREELENWKAGGIHSCHTECKRPLCMANRKIKDMREAIGEAHSILTDISGYPVAKGYVDGPCIEWYDMEEVQSTLAKLQPFIKP